MCYFFTGGSLSPKEDPPKIDPSKATEACNATVAVVPLPKGTVGIIFGQCTSEYLQRYNTYIVDADGIVLDPQVVWDAPSNSSRFEISKIVAKDFSALDRNVLSVGPFPDDRHIGLHFSHKLGPKDTKCEESVPRHITHEFKIGGTNAISFTMVNTDDGSGSGPSSYDTVVGVAVVYTTK